MSLEIPRDVWLRDLERERPLSLSGPRSHGHQAALLCPDRALLRFCLGSPQPAWNGASGPAPRSGQPHELPHFWLVIRSANPYRRRSGAGGWTLSHLERWDCSSVLLLGSRRRTLSRCSVHPDVPCGKCDPSLCSTATHPRRSRSDAISKRRAGRNFSFWRNRFECFGQHHQP